MEKNNSFDLLLSDYGQEKSCEHVSPSLATCSHHDSSLNKDQISQIDQSIIQVFDQPQTNDDHQNVKNESETNSRHYSSFLLQDVNKMTRHKNKTQNDKESDSRYITEQSMTLEQKLQNEIEEQREQLINAQDRMIKRPFKQKQQGQLYDQIKSSKINKQWERNNYSDEKCDDQSALDVKQISNLLIYESSITQTISQDSILTNSMRKYKSYSDSGQAQGQDIYSYSISNQNIVNPRKRRKYSSDVSRFFNQEGNSVDPINHYDLSIKWGSQSFFTQLNAVMSPKVINWNDTKLGDNIWILHLQLVQRNFDLEQIYLGNNQITSDGFKALGNYLHKFPNLRQVHLNNNKIMDGLFEFASNAQKCPKLRAINLRSNKITDQSISQLGIFWKNFTNLQTIQFSFNKITAHGLSEFVAHAESFPKLKIINLEHNNISDVGLKELAEHGGKLPNLQKILLQNNKITSDGLSSIAVNSHNFGNLRTIKLDKNQITDEGLIKFAENGDKFLNMTQFSFNYNNKITQNGVKQFYQHVSKFPDVPKEYFKINLSMYDNAWWLFLLKFILLFLRFHMAYNIYMFLHCSYYPYYLSTIDPVYTLYISLFCKNHQIHIWQGLLCIFLMFVLAVTIQIFEKIEVPISFIYHRTKLEQDKQFL